MASTVCDNNLCNVNDCIPVDKALGKFAYKCGQLNMVYHKDEHSTEAFHMDVPCAVSFVYRHSDFGIDSIALCMFFRNTACSLNNWRCTGNVQDLQSISSMLDARSLRVLSLLLRCTTHLRDCPIGDCIT